MLLLVTDPASPVKAPVCAKLLLCVGALLGFLAVIVMIGRGS
jgi:hypothetical protein